jgi:dephospho-CoA kinase
MPLIFITGMSGSGKSSVIRELSRRGFEAHGVDEEGYADWVSLETGKIKPYPHDNPPVGDDLHKWFADHDWVLSLERIGELKAKADAENKLIFLAGVANGDKDVWHLFDKVISLSVDEETIRKRVMEREDNEYGKHPDEMANILMWLEKHDEKYRDFGATIIDASQPLDVVVDEVVATAKG